MVSEIIKSWLIKVVVTGKQVGKACWKATQSFFSGADYAQFLVGLALVAVALLQLTVYFRQTNIMEAQAKIADEANKQTTAIQRAFVFVSGMSIERASESRTAWNVEPKIRNSGNTPAKNLRIFYVDERSNWDVPRFARDIGLGVSQEARFPPDPVVLRDTLDSMAKTDGYRASDAKEILERTSYRLVLGPQSDVPSGYLSLKNFTIDFGRDMNNVANSHFYYGVISYDDVLGAAKRHITKFCFQSGFYIGNSEDRSTFRPLFTLCPHWNCSEEECDLDKKDAETDASAEANVERERESEMERMKAMAPKPPLQPPSLRQGCLGPRVSCP